MFLSLFLLALLTFPTFAFAQSGTTQESGNISYFEFNGVTSTRQRLGTIDYYSSLSPRLNSSVQTFGNMSYGTWNDGTGWTTQRFGTMQYDRFQRVTKE